MMNAIPRPNGRYGDESGREWMNLVRSAPAK
jgi:hypothetical protein